MKIIQLLPTLAYGDAIGNDVLAINALLHNLGIETKIYAIEIDKRMPGDIAESFYKMLNVKKEDIVIYHLSIGCKAIRNYLLKQDCRKVMMYHNFTPNVFFDPYSKAFARAIRNGLWDLKILKASFEACIADSEFNKQDLRRAGYTCPIAVLPILVPFRDYEQEPDLQLISHYKNDGWKNILFVGRIAPNKCQEDLILSFTVYKKLYNSKARLFLVGNYKGMEAYYDRLQEYIKELGVTDVIFTGHTPFKTILAYYHLADVFLCMSEHEGFCVPLLEAMQFDVPLVAYSSTAIPYTLGDAGIKISTKSPKLVAAILDEVLCDTKLREKILFEQRKRLKYFQYDNISELAKRIVIHLINHENIENDETQSKTCNSNVEELLPGLEQKIENHKIAEEVSFITSKDLCSRPIIPASLNKKDRKLTVESSCSFVHNYCEQVYSQAGTKASIKKRFFGNLLNVLMEQENYLKEMDNRIKEQEERIKEQEERIKEQEKHIEDLEECVYMLL